MGIFTINVRSNVDQFSKQLDYFARKQLPFATSIALNRLAAKVKDVELQNFTKTFAHVKPFTKQAIGIIPARKDNLAAIVFVKDIQAKYLSPYEFNGAQVPWAQKKSIFTPKQIPLDAYNRIPKGKTTQLLSKQGVFMGAVKTKRGDTIYGIWQRPLAGTKTKTGRRRRATPTNQHLKLLIRFTAPLPVKLHLDYMRIANQIVMKNFQADMNMGMTVALLTAK